MEKKSFNSLTFKHISRAADDIIKYADDRRNGANTSLKTKWSKFNDACMGGIEPNVVYSIGGISGSAKSSFVNSLESDLFDLNPDIDFAVLSFSFEMASEKQVGRKLSSKLNKTTSELYSARDRLSDNDFEYMKNAAKGVKKYNVYYVDEAGDSDEIENTIKAFRGTLKPETWLLIILDHTLLIKGNGDERKIISDMQKLWIKEKKVGKTTIMQLTQMNRGIETPERVKNAQMHYPTRTDIFGSDSVYHASDYVIILHRPETIGIENYGVNQIPCIGLIFMHIIKNREGDLKILKFKNSLKYNRIEDD